MNDMVQHIVAVRALGMVHFEIYTHDDTSLMRVELDKH